MFKAFFNSIGLICIVLGILYLLGSIMDDPIYYMCLFIFLVLQVIYWIFQFMITPKGLRIVCNIIAGITIFAYFPFYNWVVDYFHERDLLYYSGKSDNWNIQSELQYIKNSIYLCDYDSITKLGGKVDTTYSGILVDPYKAGISPLSFARKRKAIEKENTDDCRLNWKGIFTDDDDLYGLVYNYRGNVILDERIPANLDSVCNALGDSISQMFGKPYYTYSDNDERIMAWTGKGLVHVVYAEDKYEYIDSYKHYYRGIVATFNPRYLRRHYYYRYDSSNEKVVSDSTVVLSFKGIRLGGSFSKQVPKALNNNVLRETYSYYRKNRDNDGVYSYSSKIATHEDEKDATISFYVFEDQIYKIKVDDVFHIDEIYREKYGDNLKFKNQHIELERFSATYVHDSLKAVMEYHTMMDKRRMAREKDEEADRQKRERQAELDHKVAEQQI